MVTPGHSADGRRREGFDAERAARIGALESWLEARDAAASDEERVAPYDELARLLIDANKLDAALGHLRERELPLHRRRGDACSIAVTMGRIADILELRGKFDAALHLRRHEELPVYERLGHMRLRAAALAKIADILTARGDLREALRILEDEVLPESSDDAASRAATMSRIADVAAAGGRLEEALRLLREDVLPVYERLGHARARTFTLGKIADILQARGETEEALRIRRDDELPVYESLGDARAHAIALGKVGLQLAASESDRADGVAMLKEALATLRALKLPQADQLRERMKACGVPTKPPKPAKPVEPGTVSFSGNFTAADLRAAACSGGEAIQCLAITNTTTLTRRRSVGLRKLETPRAWLWCKVTRAAMADVLAIKGLRELDLLDVAGRGAMPLFRGAVALQRFRCVRGLTTQDLESVAEAPALRDLNMQWSKLDADASRRLAAMPTLRELDLEGSNVDDAMIAIIATHPALERLDLANTRITATGLAHVCRMKQLRSLDLWDTAIGIDDLQQLVALDRLEYLSLGAVDGSTRRGIHVEGDPSADAGAIVDLLLRMPSLQRVWLDGVRLSAAQRRTLELRLESLQTN